MFGIYLVLNGLERFVVELIRVNISYNFIGIPTTQAEMIAIGLVILGLILIFVSRSLHKKSAEG